MLVSIPNGTDLPEDLYIYATDEDENICGYTEDGLFSSFSVGEVPTTYNTFYLPIETDKTYYTYAEIRDILDTEFPFLLDRKVKLLKEIRDIKTYEPISYMGYTFKADKVSQQDITDATLQAAMEGQSFSKMWVADEGVVNLDYQAMIGLKMAVGYRRQDLVYKCADAVQRMANMSYEQLAVFDIDIF